MQQAFMQNFSRAVSTWLLVAGFCLPLAVQSLAAQSSIRTVKVLGGRDAVELQVEASDRIVPQTQVLSGPDRLVVDFPNATPGSDLRSQSVNLGEVKDVRVGLFQAKPPITRIVLDLRTAQSFQVFPNGRTVIIKVTGAGSTDISAQANDYQPEPQRHPGLVITNYTARVEPVRVEPKPLEVTFRDGLLTIHANKATLSEVLYAVQQRTGAEVSISAGAEQEKVVADIGPAPAPEVLTQLLNGSKFNFLILNAANNPQQLDRVILSPRPERIITPPPPPVAQNYDDDEEPSVPVKVQPAKGIVKPFTPPPAAPPTMPTMPAEVKPTTDDGNSNNTNPPDQPN